MNTDHVTERLALHLDGSLTDTEAEAVEAHLSGCEACREELAYLQRIRDLVGRRSEPAPGLWAGVAARIQEERAQGIWVQFEWAGKRLFPLLAAAAVVMVSVLGGLGSDTTLEDFLSDPWVSQEQDVVMLYNADLSYDDVLVLTSAVDQDPNESR